MARATLLDLILGELHYYPFIISLDRCDGSCNTVEDLFGRIYVPKKRNKWIKNTCKRCHANVNLNLMVENAIQDKNGIMTSENLNVKKINK